MAVPPEASSSRAAPAQRRRSRGRRLHRLGAVVEHDAADAHLLRHLVEERARRPRRAASSRDGATSVACIEPEWSIASTMLACSAGTATLDLRARERGQQPGEREQPSAGGAWRRQPGGAAAPRRAWRARRTRARGGAGAARPRRRTRPPSGTASSASSSSGGWKLMASAPGGCRARRRDRPACRRRGAPRPRPAGPAAVLDRRGDVVGLLHPVAADPHDHVAGRGSPASAAGPPAVASPTSAPPSLRRRDAEVGRAGSSRRARAAAPRPARCWPAPRSRCRRCRCRRRRWRSAS